MSFIKITFFLLAVAATTAKAKPSHPFGLQAIPDHFDFAPPVLPSVPFHDEHSHVVPPPAPVYGAPAATFYQTAPHLHLPPPPPSTSVFHASHAHLFPAPAPLLPAPQVLPTAAHFLPAPAPILPPPAPIIPAPPVAHILPAPLPAPLPITQVLPPVYEALPFAASYRAIPGPKTTTHHVSVGYAFPTAHHHIAKFVATAPHAHLHAAPLSLAHHHHHNSLW